MTDYVQVSTATKTREQAVELAESVVSGRLAAGAQITGPVTGVYRPALGTSNVVRLHAPGEFPPGPVEDRAEGTLRTQQSSGWTDLVTAPVPRCCTDSRSQDR